MKPVVMMLPILLAAAPAFAGFTETAPAGVFVLDERLAFSTIDNQWTNDGELGPLIDEIVRYEPGGGQQGTLIPNAEAKFTVLINLLGFGITDDWTALVGVPVVLKNTVEPKLDWRSGDYSTTLGRSYSEDDFWEWAGSMGQPRPASWSGNQGTVADIVIGTRWRFSDRIAWFEGTGLKLAVMAFGSIPTGNPPDPEEITAAGTTSWDFHMQGDLGLHLGLDYSPRWMGKRFSVGFDVFYEVFLPQERSAGTGAIHPLLLNDAPYVGETFTVDPGDFLGASLAIDGVIWRGPTWETWLTERSGAAPDELPPLLTVTLQYTFTGVGQSNWKSDSALWDWEKERSWRPGYKNILYGVVNVSLLRVGVPTQLYAGLRTQALLPGKNVRAPNVIMVGAQVPMKFW